MEFVPVPRTSMKPAKVEVEMFVTWRLVTVVVPPAKVVAKNVVEVALVEVLFWAVKFWRVEEA